MVKRVQDLRLRVEGFGYGEKVSKVRD